ncbi:MAG: HNH endonuclease, partial [Deltaproteobacteria bacterium]|nr:HNH endonuclease [Deltaproteobacteria bacterium]
REFLPMLRRARAGESHRNPGATDGEVLTAALEALLEKQAKRKACVPAKVKREVVKRDQGKCQWKLADGGVCGATVRLEIDHVVPRGRGGLSTVENCRILCRAHNIEAARQVYGDAHMELYMPVRVRAGYRVCRSLRCRSKASAEIATRERSVSSHPGTASLLKQSAWS